MKNEQPFDERGPRQKVMERTCPPVREKLIAYLASTGIKVDPSWDTEKIQGIATTRQMKVGPLLWEDV